jgi:hypothetical protein
MNILKPDFVLFVNSVMEYRKYTIVSRPRLDHLLGLWIPYASAYWQSHDGLHFHRFAAIENTFVAEDEALFFGFLVARSWVDEHSPID